MTCPPRMTGWTGPSERRRRKLTKKGEPFPPRRLLRARTHQGRKRGADWPRGKPFPTPSTSGRRKPLAREADEADVDSDDYATPDNSLLDPDDITDRGETGGDGPGAGVPNPVVPVVPFVIMVDYDMEDAADGKDAQAEARAIKCNFDRKDIKSWLQRFEKTNGICRC